MHTYTHIYIFKVFQTNVVNVKFKLFFVVVVYTLFSHNPFKTKYYFWVMFFNPKHLNTNTLSYSLYIIITPTSLNFIFTSFLIKYFEKSIEYSLKNVCVFWLFSKSNLLNYNKFSFISLASQKILYIIYKCFRNFFF